MSHYVCRSPSMVHWHEEPPAAYTVLAHPHPLEPIPFSRYSLPLYGTLPIRIAAGTSLRHTLSLNKPTLMPHSSLHSTQTQCHSSNGRWETRGGEKWDQTTLKEWDNSEGTYTNKTHTHYDVFPLQASPTCPPWLGFPILYIIIPKKKLGWNTHFSVELFFFLSKGVFPLCLQCTFNIFAPSLYIKNTSIDPLSPNGGGRNSLQQHPVK